jgi:CRP-like cAMP-binding protein
MAPPVALLRRVSLFAGLDDADLHDLSECCQLRWFTRGSPVTNAGSRAAGFFVIEEGRATVRVNRQERQTLKRGDYFGELALIDGGRRSADITADTDMRCWGLSTKTFETFVRSHPDVAWRLMQRLVAIVREANAREARQAPRTERRRIGRSRSGTAPS